MKRTCLLKNNPTKLELFIDKQLIGNVFSKTHYFHMQRQIGMMSTPWNSYIVNKVSFFWR